MLAEELIDLLGAGHKFAVSIVLAVKIQIAEIHHRRVSLERVVHLAHLVLKGDVPNRKHHFLQNDDLDVGAHFDAKARNLWIHRHILGNGLRIYLPTDGKALEAVVGPHATNIIPSFRMAEFLEKGWISSFELQANDVIVFNQNLLHASSSGQRFRSAVNGYSREL